MSTWLCRSAALLHFCLFCLFLFYLFFLPFFLLSFEDMDVTPQAGATKRARKKTKNKNAVISASRGSDRWDVKQKHRKKGSLFTKLWKTDTPLWCKISFNLLCFLLYTDVILQQWRKVCESKCSIYCFKHSSTINRHTSSWF